MCGIAGVWGGGDPLEKVRAMTAALAHRGPDGEGTWTQAEAGIALGHRRLAIVDLSPAGSQPMTSRSGRYTLTFNGEIYNHAVLRARLAPFAFRGTSDTEVLLEAIDHWGLAAALQECVGMFAFGLWDAAESTLWLARDRLGEKPLHYGWLGDAFVFASELHAVRAIGGARLRTAAASIEAYLSRGHIPAPLSLYEGFHKALPGHVLKLSRDDWQLRRDPVSEAYWSIEAVAAHGLANPFTGTPAEADAEVARCLGEAVAGQMVADVPVGAFLSGGIDSSAVVALMHRTGGRVRTFNVGFDEGAFDESVHAREVASLLGTEHTELRLAATDLLAVVPELPALYDEPFADSSQIPTVLVSRLARRHVRVSLSGDGGDEVFGGYNRYLALPALERWRDNLPGPVVRAVARGLAAVPAQAWDMAGRSLPGGAVAALGDKVHKIATVLGAAGEEQMYECVIRLQGGAPWHDASAGRGTAGLEALAHRLMLRDTRGYLPDDVLVKVDRAAMNCSLETRAPMLDHRVVELAWSLPLAWKITGGVTKRPLRAVLAAEGLPAALFDRPKAGFAIPLAAWLRGPLRDWGAAAIDASPFRDAALPRWHEHLSGRRDWAQFLWAVILGSRFG